MKSKKSDDDAPNFIPYDDENLEHVLSGPDYGQVDSNTKESAWEEIESKEYSDFVSEITTKILKHPILKLPNF